MVTGDPVSARPTGWTTGLHQSGGVGHGQQSHSLPLESCTGATTAAGGESRAEVCATNDVWTVWWGAEVCATNEFLCLDGVLIKTARCRSRMHLRIRSLLGHIPGNGDPDNEISGSLMVTSCVPPQLKIARFITVDYGVDIGVPAISIDLFRISVQKSLSASFFC